MHLLKYRVEFQSLYLIYLENCKIYQNVDFFQGTTHFQEYLICEKIHKPNFMSYILSFKTRKGGHVSLHLSF